MKINSDIINKAKNIINRSDFKNKLSPKNSILEEVKSELKEDKIIIENSLDKNIFKEELIKEFIDFVKKEFGIDKPIFVRFADNREGFQTHAYYTVGRGEVHVYAKNRAIMDVFRSTVHEIKHYLQDIENRINSDNSVEDNTGYDIENEANSVAGIIIRKWGKFHPEMYDC